MAFAHGVAALTHGIKLVTTLDNRERHLLVTPVSPVHQVSGLLTKLNLATRHLHADVDDPWLDLLRIDVTLADYSTQLVRTYGLIAPFESACKYTPGVARLLDYRQLLRAGLIARDLTNEQIAARLGVSVATVKTHINRAYGKLALGSRAEAAQRARALEAAAG